MSGLLAGLLGVLALPPLSIEPAGWVWLVPWITTLNHPLPERLTAALLTAGLPLGVAVAPAAASEPALTGLVIVAVLAPFIVTTGLATGRTGATSIPRIGAALVGFCCLLAGLRAVGLPMSLGLFLPAGDAHFPIIALAGPFVADLAIMLINTALAVSGMQARPAGAKPPALQPVLAASLGLAPLGLAEIEPIAGDGDERLRIAVVQTDITPQTRQRIVGDGELEALQRRQRHQARIAHRLDADRIVWPESSMPGLLRPGWTTAAVPGHHLRHGYAYSRPGHLRSEVRGRQGDDPSRIGSDQRWTKRFPLPFAERGRLRAHQAGVADGLASGMGCSSAPTRSTRGPLIAPLPGHPKSSSTPRILPISAVSSCPIFISAASIRRRRERGLRSSSPLTPGPAPCFSQTGRSIALPAPTPRASRSRHPRRRPG